MKHGEEMRSAIEVISGTNEFYEDVDLLGDHARAPSSYLKIVAEGIWQREEVVCQRTDQEINAFGLGGVDDAQGNNSNREDHIPLKWRKRARLKDNQQDGEDLASLLDEDDERVLVASIMVHSIPMGKI